MTDKEKLCCNSFFINLVKDKGANKVHGIISFPIEIRVEEGDAPSFYLESPNENELKSIILSTTNGAYDQNIAYCYIFTGADPLSIPRTGGFATENEGLFNDSIGDLYTTDILGEFTYLTIIAIKKQ